VAWQILTPSRINHESKPGDVPGQWCDYGRRWEQLGLSYGLADGQHNEARELKEKSACALFPVQCNENERDRPHK
jgi:hypothetical protein